MVSPQTTTSRPSSGFVKGSLWCESVASVLRLGLGSRWATLTWDDIWEPGRIQWGHQPILGVSQHSQSYDILCLIMRFPRKKMVSIAFMIAD